MEQHNNMEDPLKSSLSVKILRGKSIKLLSAMLNPPKIIHTDEGLSRNWKGLAELCNIESYLISNLEFDSDPTREFLRIWQGKGDEATIGLLIFNLEKLDRFDVIDDIHASIADDIEFHKQHPNGYKKQTPLLYPDHDRHVLTVDDVANIENNIQLIKYDAFVLFADDDIDFATKVIETMEKQYNLKFCVKDRDLVGGTFEHNAIIKLISERCEKLIVILSPSFFKSTMNTFFLSFTQAISLISPETRKIVPCLYKQCPNMPPEIRCYHLLDYTKPMVLRNFWDKLYEAVKTQKAPAKASNRIGMPDLPPRQFITKTHSQRDSQCRLLRLPFQPVKYNSLVDLTKTDQILSETNLIPSTSANSLGLHTYTTTDRTADKKTTKQQKKNWFIRKLLPNKYVKNLESNCRQQIKTNGQTQVVEGGGHREKKGGFVWHRFAKRKVEVAT